MRIAVRLYLVVFGLCLAFSLRADPGPMSIWFTGPGAPGNTASWQQEALPVGNGKLAAMIYGGVGTEQIQFNEDTIWGGQPHDYSNPNSTLARLQAIQTKCFNTNAVLADYTNYLMGVPFREAAYQAPGALVLTFFPHSGKLNYLRSLSLDTATVNVHYDYNTVTYNRDIFASAPSNKVIVLRFTASQAAKIAFTCSFTTSQTATYSTVGNDLIMHASVSAIADGRYFAGLTNALFRYPGLTNGVKYDARVRLITTNGTVTTTGSSISVTNANEVVLVLSVVSNVKHYNDLTADYVTPCSNNVAAAAALGYPVLRQAQQADYTNLYNRAVLDLGCNSARTNSDIGYRKKQIAVDGNDPQLVTLAFQLGRYLTISGSRPGSQALNLQGKWNDSTAPSWDSKMTLNINESLNYSGTEAANLSECTLPLFDMIQDLSVTGNKVARANYFCTNSDPTLTNAWVAHHNTDLWRDAAACNGADGIWPTGGAWLCQNLWWHYDYTGDTNWLRDIGYPLMRGAAQFFAGFLVPHPTPAYTNANGDRYMVTCPSYSPEHDEPGYGSNIPGPTMDNELIRDLFKHVIAASAILNTDAVFRANIAGLKAKLPPQKVGKYGQLQEWLEDVDSNPDGHRHCSHLVGISPGDEISPFYPTWYGASNVPLAARVSVDFRGDGGTDTPWCKAVRINLRDRVQDGEGAFRMLTNLLSYSKLATNLVFADNNRQLDANFGMLSGIAEMFLQSQSGEVFLLPALPKAFTNGMVSGLCARGGFEVDNMTWTNGRLTGATIYSKVGNTCRLRPRIPVDIMLGTNSVAAPMVLPGLYQFSTIAGSNYTIVPANVAETENLTATFSAGDTHTVVTNAAFSNWRGTLLTANAASDYVTYTVSNLTAGTYHLYVGADAGANRGKFQLAAGPSGGTLTNVGSVQDTYSPTNVVYLLPIKLTTPTNLIVLWTNLLKEFDCTNWQAPSNGNYQFKFTVDSKNANSSGYNLAFDYIKFTPATSQSAPSNAAPTTPVNLAPANGAANQSPAVALQASTFSDPDNGDTHAASEWLVWRGSTSVFDSGTDTVNKANLTMPAGALDYGTTYNWQVRYQDNHGLWGGYSTQTTFSTVVPMLGASGLGGKLVFAWPTNTAGFSLECATNLPSTSWIAATPPPVVAGGAYVVTNALTAEKMFYRLHKP